MDALALSLELPQDFVDYIATRTLWRLDAVLRRLRGEPGERELHALTRRIWIDEYCQLGRLLTGLEPPPEVRAELYQVTTPIGARAPLLN